MVFDSSSLISLATNNLFDKLGELKSRFDGKFFITESVKKEILDNPIHSNKFKLEAIMMSELLQQNVLKLFANLDMEKKAMQLLEICNNIYSSNGNPLKILDKAEVESLVLAITLNAVYIVDERTMRLLVEDPKKLSLLLERKFDAQIKIDGKNLAAFKSEIRNVQILRSAEIMVVAFELGLFKQYETKYLANPRKEILEGILWGLRLRGCAISTEEIADVIRLEGFR
ncbi:hypothetical protein J4425_00680 [Candidatus Woesearchaeota archaeon]|nr:hypothetical protein [Candidatus Woesearchaeota archaeon]